MENLSFQVQTGGSERTAGDRAATPAATGLGDVVRHPAPEIHALLPQLPAGTAGQLTDGHRTAAPQPVSRPASTLYPRRGL